MNNRMTRRELLKGAAILGAGFGMGAGAPLVSGVSRVFAQERTGKSMLPAGKDRPNIVFIMADDLGYGDLGCYGSMAINTTHIDSLATGGMMFTDFYVCSPVCTPSRYGLLTGRYPARADLNLAFLPPDIVFKKRIEYGFYQKLADIGLLDSGDPGTCQGLRGDEYSLARGLKDAGYATCLVGKWHLGYTEEYLPNANGFDYFYGTPGVNDMKPFRLMRDNEVIEEDVADQGTLTKRYTEEALAFMEREKERPFFLFFSHTFPHIPLHASEDFLGTSEGGLYGDTVEEIDWSVGKVLDKLDELGVTDNTIVIFTSDNGPWYEGSPGGLRGGKGLAYEGGVRVPMIIKWPGVVSPGAVNHAVASNLDFCPTFIALAGAEMPEDRVIDGEDILPLFLGSEESPHEAIYYYHAEKVEGIRVGEWKYIRKHNVYVWPSNLQFKGPWLFNMETDPQERYDLSMNHPDIVEKLEGMIADWETSMNASRP